MLRKSIAVYLLTCIAALAVVPRAKAANTPADHLPPNQVFDVIVKLDGQVLNSRRFPIITVSGIGTGATVHEYGYAQCVPGGLRAAIVNLGVNAQVNVHSDGSATFTTSAAVLRDAPSAAKPEHCVMGELPVRAAHWNVIAALQPNASITRMSPNGFELIIHRLPNLDVPESH